MKKWRENDGQKRKEGNDFMKQEKQAMRRVSEESNEGFKAKKQKKRGREEEVLFFFSVQVVILLRGTPF